MKDKRILTEVTGKWVIDLLLLIFVMVVLSYGGSWLLLTHDVGYVIGIATAVIVTQLWKIEDQLKKIKKDIK